MATASVVRLIATPTNASALFRDKLPSGLGTAVQNVTVLVLVNQQLAALETHTSRNLDNFLNMLHGEKGFGEFDVAKVTRRVHVGLTIGGTNHAWIQDTHASVKESTDHRFVVVVRVARSNFDDGIAENLFGRQHRKLDTNDARRSIEILFPHGGRHGWDVTPVVQGASYYDGE